MTDASTCWQIVARLRARALYLNEVIVTSKGSDASTCVRCYRSSRRVELKYNRQDAKLPFASAVPYLAELCCIK